MACILLQKIVFEFGNQIIIKHKKSRKVCGFFYEAFDIKEGDGMYLAPEDRVRIW